MNLPADFESYTRKLFGEELYSVFLDALNSDPPVSIRINPFKKVPSAILENSSMVPWCKYGYYLSSRPAFTFDPLLHAGSYYVQEASSMFICEVARQLFDKPLVMLDLCAAPGGKTTALRSVLPEGSLLFTNEPIKNRASILKENVQKWGHPDVIVTNNYPKDYKRSKMMFDAILADVPCSGEGMFRKDPNAIKEWSVQNVEKCQQLQRSIIEDIWQCLRPGGILIYSTCTFNAHEDEENVKWIKDTLGAESISISISEEWKSNHPLQSLWGDGIRFIPGITLGEGLYMAVLRKKKKMPEEADTIISNESRTRNNIKRLNAKAAPRHNSNSQNFNHDVAAWLDGEFSVFEDHGFLRAIPNAWRSIYSNVKDRLHIIHAGVGLGTMKGKDIIPDTSLALSQVLSKTAFPKFDLTYEDAIRYLRKEALTLKPSVDKGFTIVSYDNCPLGFVKNLGSRANNLYPQEWRIKSTYMP